MYLTATVDLENPKVKRRGAGPGKYAAQETTPQPTREPYPSPRGASTTARGRRFGKAARALVLPCYWQYGPHAYAPNGILSGLWISSAYFFLALIEA